VKKVNAPKYFVDLFDEGRKFLDQALELANVHDVDLDVLDGNKDAKKQEQFSAKIMEVRSQLVPDKRFIFDNLWDLSTNLRKQAWIRFNLNNPSLRKLTDKEYNLTTKVITAYDPFNRLIDGIKKSITDLLKLS
jgi:hypothetical protein